jgi:hypothetical protein
MSLWWATAIVVVVAGVAVATLLVIRHFSPHGGHFGDTSRAAGVFSILATSFAVLFAFIVFLAFTAYDKTRTGAETEANTVAQQFETAQLLPPDAGARLSGQLICYGRSVVHQEWPQMVDGKPPAFNPWAVPLFGTIKSLGADTPNQAAYAEWLTQTSMREQARQDRVHGASGVIPPPLWFVFLVSGGIVLAFVFFFADRGEGALVQAIQVGAVAAMLTASVLVISFLDHPYHPGAGSIRPVAMQQTLDRMQTAATAIHLDIPNLCDDSGSPPAPTASGG